MLARCLKRVLRRKLRRAELTEQHADAVRQILTSDKHFELLVQRVNRMQVPVGGERPITDWLAENWLMILQLILRILGSI